MSEFVPVTIRFPRDLHDRIEEIAAEEHRSLSSQVIIMLEAEVEA